MAAKEQAIQIYVRMRPLLRQFEDEEAWRIDKQSNSINSITRDLSHMTQNLTYENISIIKRRYADAYYNYNFNFDQVFDITDETEFVYHHSCRQHIQMVLSGFNATIFMYGQTTSGKTFTMLGNDENPGLLPFTLLDVFKEIVSTLHPHPLKDQSGQKYSVLISYLEIYNEQINDLLNPGMVNLKMHEDAKGNPIVNQLKICEVTTFDQAIALLKYGEEQRSYREKNIHEHSSRSHTIFQLVTPNSLYVYPH